MAKLNPVRPDKEPTPEPKAPKAPPPTVSEVAMRLLEQLKLGIGPTGLTIVSGKVRVSVNEEVADRSIFRDDETRQAQVEIWLDLENLDA